MRTFLGEARAGIRTVFLEALAFLVALGVGWLVAVVVLAAT